MTEAVDVGPCSLYQEHIATMHTFFTQIMPNVFVIATDTQDIDIVLGTEATFLYGAVDHLGRLHQKDFSDTDVVEVKRLAFLRLLV